MATAEAECLVTVRAVERVGADYTIPLAPDCSGHGTRIPGYEQCDCDAGYEGDLCEIPPCAGHGTLQSVEAVGGVVPTDGLGSFCDCDAHYQPGYRCSVNHEFTKILGCASTPDEAIDCVRENQDEDVNCVA